MARPVVVPPRRQQAGPVVAGRGVLAATILGSSMVFIDGTVVNVALPALQRNLNAASGAVQWVVEAYALFLAALMLVGGSLGDRYGRKRVFAIGVVLFTLASAGCGLAQSIGQLITARAMQGVGAALLTPGSLAIIGATFDDEVRGRAVGTWSGFTTMTSALGPVLGGWLVEHASWRWIFFINLPLSAVVLLLLYRYVPESRGQSAQGALDWPGALLATGGLGAVVYGLIRADEAGLSDTWVLGTLAMGLTALALFVLVEARSRVPIMPLAVFRSRTFSGVNLLTLLLYSALGGALYFVPFNLIQVQHYSPAAAGASMLPLIAIMFTLSRWSGGLVRRHGARLPLLVGPIVAAGGFALFARPDRGGAYWTTYFPAVAVLGLGMAITVAPLVTAVLGAVDTRHSGLASGINNAVARSAGLLAIAVLGILALATFNHNLDAQLARLRPPYAVRLAIDAQHGKMAAIVVPHTVREPERIALETAIAEAFVAAFRTVMLVAAGLALASALAGALLIEGKVRAPG